MSYDANVVVTVSSGAPAVDRQTFGTVLCLVEGISIANTWVEYTDNATAQADGDLDAVAKAMVATAFSQTPPPPRVRVGKTTQSVTPYDNAATDLDAILVDGDGANFYGLAIGSRTQTVIEAVAAWAETNKRLFVAQSSDATILTATASNVAENLQASAYDYTALNYHATDSEYSDVAWLTRGLIVDPDVETTVWAYKNLAGITANRLDGTEVANLKSQDCNAYSYFFGNPATGPKGVLSSGNYIDTRITKDWLAARGGERLAQILLDTSQRGGKVAYDQTGIDLMIGELEGLLLQGERVGHFLEASGTVNPVLRADVPSADVTGRVLNLTGSAILAGAVQEVNFSFGIISA